MGILTTLVFVVIIIAIIATLFIAGKADENYSSSTKKNTKNLTMIYAVVIPLSFIVLALFIVFFT
ncbi:hypothetical protein [Neobacillus kokaensis]|uniref:BshB3 potential contributor to bacillithiol synthesis n=1 Tax=Neobacillus kokaensis TaxID=2759023 RepID=A0ABQ3MXR8_9BACI|nr:hypothetical protein [Neobacillus kokaensis]GHH96634.1 hypothetical protein AM1BK_01770 [Neobacillus kokaensis]